MHWNRDWATQIVPVCELCWLSIHSHWEPQGVYSDGRISTRLTGVEVPEKLNDGTVEVCAVCAAVTVAGIYDIYEFYQHSIRIEPPTDQHAD